MKKLYKTHILKRASKDAIIPHRWNEKILKRLCQEGYLHYIGYAQKGKYKGMPGYIISEEGAKHLSELQQTAKEDRRFYITILATLIGGAIGFILGRIFP